MTVAKEIGIQLIAWAISEVILVVAVFFAPTISSMLNIEAYSIQIALVIIGILIAGFIIYRIAQVRKKLRNESPHAVINRKPNYIAKTVPLEHFGVKWNALVGSLLRGNFINGDYYVFVEGPFCPNCGVELVSRNMSKWWGLSYKEVWHCPKCDKSYERPKLYLYEEDKIVEKLVKAQL